MKRIDQLELIQNIANDVLPLAEDGWEELVIAYSVDDEQSESCISYAIMENGEFVEKSLIGPMSLDDAIRELRAEIAGEGKPEFSSCRLLFSASGNFEATYGYDEVDWDGLMLSGWNFPSIAKKSAVQSGP